MPIFYFSTRLEADKGKLTAEVSLWSSRSFIMIAPRQIDCSIALRRWVIATIFLFIFQFGILKYVYISSWELF